MGELELDLAERELLLYLLERELEDTRVEVRHTQNSEFKAELHVREELLRKLLERVGHMVLV